MSWRVTRNSSAALRCVMSVAVLLTIWILSNLLFAGLLILQRVIIPRWDEIRDHLLPFPHYHHHRGHRAVGH
jgi:hypothetical protein